MNISGKFWLCVLLVVVNCTLAVVGHSVDALTVAGLCGVGALAFFVVENTERTDD